MSFLKEIEKNKNLRKIFGDRELMIIRKQLLGVKLKPSEKTRLSRDIRKKLEVIKDLAPYVNEFSVKHGSIIKENINDSLEAIKESKYFPEIRKIILFGGAAEKKLSLLSDIDIAVEFYKIDSARATKFIIQISGKVQDRVDVQVYNILPNKIKKEIDKKGVILYERNKRPRGI